jgi:hypothetical protein
MTRYRVEYTEVKPGNYHDLQCDMIDGDLTTVRDYFDARHISAVAPILVIEQTKSDGYGRVVPASEWDVMED